MSDTTSNERSATRSRFGRRIRAFSKVRRGLRNATLACRLGTVMLAVLTVLLVTPLVRLDLPWVDAVALTLAGVLLLVLLGRYLWRRLRYDGDLSEAFRMEELAGGLNSRLISALDFLDRRQDSPLTAATIAAAERDFEQIAFEARLDRGARRNALKRLLGVALAVLILGATPWFGFARLLRRGDAAWAAVREWLFPTEWELFPGAGRHVHLIGDSVDVGLRFIRHGFADVALVREEADGTFVDADERLPVDADGRAVVSVSRASESQQRLAFAFGRRPFRTAVTELIFTTRPIVENMQIGLIPPSYTRQPPRDLEGVQTRIAGLPGTRVAMGLTFSKPLSRATLRFDGETQEIPLDVVGRFAAMQFVISEPRRARIQIVDLHGFGLRTPHSLDIDILVDEPPRVAVPGFLKAEMPIKAEGLRAFGFGVRAWDDYGVTRTTLKWRQSTLDNRSAITAQSEVERVSDPPLAQVVADFSQVFADLEVRPGDVVTFSVEVADNREPDAQTTSSPTFSFFIHRDDLDSALMGSYDFMFGHLAAAGGRGRIGRFRAATDVPAPRDLRSVSQLRSDYEADIRSASRPPTVRGDFGTSVELYYQILSTARFSDEDK